MKKLGALALAVVVMLGVGLAPASAQGRSLWTLSAELTVSEGGTPDDDFGATSAIDGHIAVVGAPHDGEAGYGAGAAYVFERTRSGWVQAAKLIASDPDTDSAFGSAVAVDEGTVVVGAWLHGDAGDGLDGHRTGAAYVFEESGFGWVETAKLTASDGFDFDDFGRSLDIDGDTIVVGARGNQGVGAAYLFERSGSSWVETAKLSASDGDSVSDDFGESVSIDGGTVVVGSSGDDGPDGEFLAGSVYVFERTRSSWVEAVKLHSPAPVAYESFGYAVAFDDATLAVTTGDSVYVFGRAPSGWIETGHLLPSVGSFAGFSVAVDGGIVAVGGGYVFERTRSGWLEEAILGGSTVYVDDGRIIVNTDIYVRR